MTNTAVAAIQMISGKDLQANLLAAESLVMQAAEAGARLIVLPETFAMFSTRQQQSIGDKENSEQAVIRPFLQQLASRLGVWLVAGTIPLAVDGSDRVLSSSFIIDDKGKEVARYDKIHMFDVDVADNHGSYRESATFLPGDHITVVDTPFGRLGVVVCYDIRFPELFRLMTQQGLDIVAVPAAFTLHTGEAHWLPLLRARAIENQCYIVGANQGGKHNEKRATSGGSVIIDGWGNVLAEAGRGEGVVMADIDLDVLEKLRRNMPVHQHQRFRIIK